MSLPNASASNSTKHCVFRCDEYWFSLPALAVREIAIAPDLSTLPGCSPSMLGLCHLRNEFVPVVDLNTLLDLSSPTPGKEYKQKTQLLVCNTRAAWALSISECAMLEDLETSISSQKRCESVLGTALFQDKIVRVLHPNELYASVQRSLESCWKSQSTVSQLQCT